MDFNYDTINLFVNAQDISERKGFTYVPEIILFGTLAVIEESPLHNYLINKGMKDLEIAREVKKIYDEYFKDEREKERESFTKLVLVTGKVKRQALEMIITPEVQHILEKANDIAENMYLDPKINNSYILAAFSELMPDIYEEFITACLGVNILSPSTIISDEETIGCCNTNLVIPRSLSSFLTLLNDKYSPDEEYCRILGREKETGILVKILAKATKRNAVLVGYPGVGKTAIVEKFVWDIVKGNCYERFKDAKVLALDVTSIIAGTKYRGDAESRFQELIKFLENNPGCILFIDEIHTILGAGACKDGELDLANSLKPILARGDTQVIGATTFEEYEKYFSKDGALKRRFEKIVVREPKSEELYDMIKNQILKLEEFLHTKISRELVDFAILNASCFNYETKNPDRTLDLIDRVMAGAELKGKSEITREDILENFDIRKKQFEKMSEETKYATAYHEAGHYIVQRFSSELKHYHTLAISIIPAEDYLGVNVYEEDEDATPSRNREYFIQLIAKSLGGRRAEKIYTNELSAGANSDLAKATRIAKDMVTRYGLDESFTEDRVYLRESENPMYTDKIIEKISNEIDKILDEAKKYADKILSIHQYELELLVEQLMKNGMVSKNELDKIFSDSEISAIIKAELKSN